MIAFEPQRKEKYFLSTSGKPKAKTTGSQEPSLLDNAKCDKSQMLAHCYFLATLLTLYKSIFPTSGSNTYKYVHN